MAPSAASAPATLRYPSTANNIYHHNDRLRGQPAARPARQRLSSVHARRELGAEQSDKKHFSGAACIAQFRHSPQQSPPQDWGPTPADQQTEKCCAGRISV
jgi:hypothetical protein